MTFIPTKRFVMMGTTLQQAQCGNVQNRMKKTSNKQNEIKHENNKDSSIQSKQKKYEN